MKTRRSFWTRESLVITHHLVRIHAFDGEQVERLGRVERIDLPREMAAQDDWFVFAQGLLEVGRRDQLLNKFFALLGVAEVLCLQSDANLLRGIAGLARDREVFF